MKKMVILSQKKEGALEKTTMAVNLSVAADRQGTHIQAHFKGKS
jgi:hypothetical protein